MKTRIISGVVGVVLAVAILLCGGVYGVTASSSLLAAVATMELLRAAGFAWRWRVPAIVAAALCPLAALADIHYAAIVAGAYWLFTVCAAVVKHDSLSVEQVSLLWMLPTVAAAGFTALAALRTRPEGLLFLLVSLVIPWLSDTGAYFTGVCFGKHKLCPQISPKKTVEGLCGGVVASIAATALTGFIYRRVCGACVGINWVSLLTVAAVGAPLSVMGDLFASVIKRRFQVKDYGRIMPGHGGVMDRFDSVLPVAILLWIWTSVWPLAAQVAAGY